MRRLLAVMLVFLASIFAEPPNADPVKAACGADADKFDVELVENAKATPTPEPGKALVYIINHSAFDSAIVRFGLNGAWLGANRGESYLFFQVARGEHHLCADWQPGPMHRGKMRSLAPLQAEPGQIYYFRTRFMLGGGGGGPATPVSLDLDPINSDEARMLIAESSPSKATPRK